METFIHTATRPVDPSTKIRHASVVVDIWFGMVLWRDDKPDEAWTETGPLMLEVGFGNGVNLIENAVNNPTHRFLGIEVHRPAIGAALLQIEEKGLTNVRLIRGDVRPFLCDFHRVGIFSRICIMP